jgi:two-component system LytT family response regulator
MKKIKTLIVDDEKHSRYVLKTLLDDFRTELDIVGEAASVAEAYTLIQRLQPDLVFLDIQMPLATGFALLRKFEKIPFKVIFVTSFDQYAINAIKFSALDYLLKPVETLDLHNAVKKAMVSIRSEEKEHANVVTLLHNLDHEQKKPRIAVHAAEKVLFINTESIVCIESNDGCCNIITAENTRFSTARYLKDFEDYLGENSSFVRIHKSCMINADHIRGYNKGEPFIIEMKNGQTFEVSRRKKPEVLDKLKMK